MKYIKIMLCLLSGMLIYSSCIKENSEAYTSEYSSLLEIADEIGKKHNEGLELFYNTNESECVETWSSDVLINRLENNSLNFLKSEFEATSTQWESIEFVLSIVSKDINEYYSEGGKSNGIIQHIVLQYEITSPYLKYLNYIDEVLNNLSDLQIILSVFDQIEEMALKDPSLGNDERLLVLSSLYTAKYSSIYWSENFETWKLLNCTREVELRWFSWGDVVKNDVAYGAGGGIAGAFIGGSVSFGVLTVPGWVAGAVGGAIGGSAGNGLLQVLDHIWP